MNFTNPVALPYAYDALVPYIDGRTMELHHTKHHQAYVDNLNQAIIGTVLSTAQDLEVTVLHHLLRTISNYNMTIRNHGGGHFNHLFFWDSLTPKPDQPNGKFRQALIEAFGSFEAFKEAFTAAAAAHFGSGWAWLIMRNDGRLLVTRTANQDNPLMDVVPIAEQGVPILGLDVWEHAYYLHYQNKRLAYIEAFWHIVHWERVEARFSEARKATVKN